MRKKLFAVIMSVMMMVTFMPTMAFAALTPGAGYAGLTGVERINKVVYGSDYTTATAYCTKADGKEVVIEGFCAADTDKPSFDTSKGAMKVIFTFASDDYWAGTVTKYFYNMAGAKIVGGSSEVDADTLVTYEGAALAKNGSIPARFVSGQNPLGDSIKFFNPNNSKQGTIIPINKLTSSDAYTGAGTVNMVNSADAGVLDIFVSPSGYEPYNEGEVTFPVYIGLKSYDTTVTSAEAGWVSQSGTNDLTDGIYGFTGQAPSEQKATVKVGDNFGTLKAKVNDQTAAQDITAPFTTSYTGENVKFDLQAKGYTAKYQLVDFSGKAAEYSETFPEFKNVGTYLVKAEITKNVGTKATKTFQIKVTVNALDVKLGTAKKPASGAIKFRKGDEIKISDLVSVVASSEAYKNLLAKADVETWKKIVDTYATADEFDSNIGSSASYGTQEVTVKLDKAKLVKDTDKDIEQFLDNYNFVSANPYETSFELQFVEGYNDVTAVSQTKTVKAGKKVTFKLKGDSADWGKLTYLKTKGNSKISVAKAGKVTVKKGLKKGKTYTVKIKVKAPNASAMKTLKVKVK